MSFIKTTSTIIVVFLITYSTGKKLFCEIFEPQSNHTICIIEDLYTQVNHQVDLEINDKHYRPNGEHENLEMRFVSCDLFDIPKGLFIYYATITKLVIKNGQLNEIGRNKFENALKLQHLDLSRNKIKNLIDAQFSGSNLTYLNLANNEIDSIPYLLFDDLNHLHEIDLSNNKIKVMYFSIKDISNTLKMINLRNNKVSQISHFWLSNIIYLKHLDISGNELESFWCSNTVLETIYLQHNRLTEFRSIGHGNLRILNLAFNKLSNFIVEDIDKLKSLDLSINRLSNFETITSFNLNYLSLQFTGIQQTDFHIFNQLKDLKSVDISNNNLEKIDLTIFKENKKMLRFYINGNNLTELNYEIIHIIFPHLRIIYMFDNNWNCSYLQKFVKYLKHWDIQIFYDPYRKTRKHINATSVEGILCDHFHEDTIQLIPNEDMKREENSTNFKLDEDEDDVIENNEQTWCTADDHQFNFLEFFTWTFILIGYIWVGYKILMWFKEERNKRNKYFEFCGL